VQDHLNYQNVMLLKSGVEGELVDMWEDLVEFLLFGGEFSVCAGHNCNF
jgi:hypothetical protein